MFVFVCLFSDNFINNAYWVRVWRWIAVHHCSTVTKCGACIVQTHAPPPMHTAILQCVQRSNEFSHKRNKWQCLLSSVGLCLAHFRSSDLCIWCIAAFGLLTCNQIWVRFFRALFLLTLINECDKCQSKALHAFIVVNKMWKNTI